MKLLHKNSLSGVGQLALTAGLTFFSIPVFIRALGEEAYGAFSIVTLAGNLNIFANLGLNTALLKFLSTQGKSKESDHDIAVTIGLLLAIMLPLSVIAITQQAFILQGLLGLSDSLYTQVASLYRCVVMANLIVLLGQTFTTILDSQQRMYVTSFYQLIYSVLYWGGIIAMVSIGYGMSEVGVVILGAAIIWFGLVVIAAWRSWGWLDLSGLRLEAIQVARKQLTLSAKVYSAGLLVMLFEPMTKVLVSRLIGVREVGYLEIAYKVKSQLWSVLMKMTYPIYPRIAQESNLRSIGQLIRSYQIGMSLILLPFMVFFIAVLPDIFTLWLPSPNPIITISTLCISITFIINSLSIPPYYFLMGRNHASKIVYVQLTNVGVSLLISLLTYQKMGVYGFVLGNSVAILTSMALCLFYQKRYLGEFDFDGINLRSLLITTLITVGLVFVSTYLLSEPWQRVATASVCTMIMCMVLLRRSMNIFKSSEA